MGSLHAISLSGLVKEAEASLSGACQKLFSRPRAHHRAEAAIASLRWAKGLGCEEPIIATAWHGWGLVR